MSEINYVCNGCKHKGLATTETCFCYMFDNKPEIIPCGQHDKYEVERRLTGAMMRKHPFMTQLLVLEALGNRKV